MTRADEHIATHELNAQQVGALMGSLYAANTAGASELHDQLAGNGDPDNSPHRENNRVIATLIIKRSPRDETQSAAD